MNVSHTLKCWPDAFQAIMDDRKRFEVRCDDRGYKVGDELLLCEWDPRGKGMFTGREQRCKVTYVLKGEFGVHRDYVVMSIDEVRDA